MFNDIDNIQKMVEGSYKKLKSYYYYDKTFLYKKYKISEFESSGLFGINIEKISKAILNADKEYFDTLINQIDFKVFPKKLDSNDNKSDVTKSNSDLKKDISKINFYMDLPIELCILDFLWMLLIGKIYNDNFGQSAFSYAGKFKKSIFNNSYNLIEGIDFDSNRCFQPYYSLYSDWRDKAFEKVKEKQTKTDNIILTLDIKNFYYSVEFEFQKLGALLNNDPRINSFRFLTNIIEKIYRKYTQLICEYKKGIKKSDDTCIFPIGIISPIVLREIYLMDLDNLIYKEIKPYYYGRYVDDILLVIDASNQKKFTKQEYINTYLISKNIALPVGQNNLKFNLYPNLLIQNDKINCFYFEKNAKEILIDVYYEKLRRNSSEAKLLPDMDLLNESFNNNAYNITNLENSNKIRDLGLMLSNNYKAVRFVNGLKKILKNTTIDHTVINGYLDDIIEFYSGSQGIEYINSWCSVFELLVLCGDMNRANKFFKNLKSYIDILSFNSLNGDEIYKNQYKKILQKLKKDLKEHLELSISLSIALNYNVGEKRNQKYRDKAKIFRVSNMFNHHLVSLPLINYSTLFDTTDEPLNNLDILAIGKEEMPRALFKLDEFKMRYSPRYIFLDEFYLCSFLYYVNDDKLHYQNDRNIYEKYLEYNNLNNRNVENPVIRDDLEYCSAENSDNIVLRKICVLDCNKKQYKVGLVNTSITEETVIDCLVNPKTMLTVNNKQRIFKLLNNAKDERVDYIVFPEFYYPLAWLPDVVKFCKENRINIITGLQYLTWENRAYNMTCTVKSTTNTSGFKDCLIYLREKNYYAPSERLLISRKGYKSVNKARPIYYIIDNGNFSFSTILCFEFTDIKARAKLKGKVDALFVPQLNKDTHYFSSIVESASRDMHCFIVQANTSDYGDSRITAPYKNDYKNIMQIKGGKNDVLLVSNLEIEKLRIFQHNYRKEFDSTLSRCFKCNKVYKENYKRMIEICSNCPDNLGKSPIKGLPPDFNR